MINNVVKFEKPPRLMYFNICVPFMLFFVLCNCLVAGGLKKTVSDTGSISVKVYL